jgi:hypothetical protein
MKKKNILISLAILALLALTLTYKACFHRPRFNPDVIAAAETQMWQAYYSNDKVQLARQLVKLHRNQFGLTLSESIKISRHLANAAMRFRNSKSNYRNFVLPELVLAYTRIQKATGRNFDPERAAWYELSWWEARRNPSRNSDEIVGQEIANLYAELYGQTNQSIQNAGLLRAQAAALRDHGGDNADWQTIEQILLDSYQQLARGIQS